MAESHETTIKGERGVTPSRWGRAVALCAVIAGPAAVRLRLLAIPLERDEGEYAYGGKLLLQGIVPFDQLYTLKYPGIHAVYAGLLALFGETAEAIHLGLLVANIATTMLVYWIAQRFFGGFAAVVSAAAFALLSLGIPVQGLSANAEHFAVLVSLGGLACLLRSDAGARRLWLCAGGLLLGSAVVIKQQAVVFPAAGGLYLLASLSHGRGLSRSHALGRLLAFAAAALLPLAAMLVTLWLSGVFESFWFWTFTYAGTYSSSLTHEQLWRVFLARTGRVVSMAPALWSVSGIGLIAVVGNARIRGHLAFLAPWLLLSAVGVGIGLHFRPHYYVFVLPAAAILFGASTHALQGLAERRLSRPAAVAASVTLVIFCFAQSIWKQWDLFFVLTPHEVTRKTYGANPFPESLAIAEVVRELTDPDDSIAVLGSEPQLYFYADRPAASGYIYMYPLTENQPLSQQMQEDMIAEVAAADPAVLVLVSIKTSWYPSSDVHAAGIVSRWFRDYRKQYQLVAVVELGKDTVRVLRGDDLARIPEDQGNLVEVYARKR